VRARSRCRCRRRAPCRGAQYCQASRSAPGRNVVAEREVDQGELERLASALRLAESALEEAIEAAENLGNFDRRFDVPRALGGAQRLIANANEAGDAARRR